MVFDSVVKRNFAFAGGGTASSDLQNCTLKGNRALDAGGGAVESTLRACLLIGNSAAWSGGLQAGKLYNCTVFGNQAKYGDGGAAVSSLLQCTVTDNSGGWVGGVHQCSLDNCIVYQNSNGNYFDSTFRFSCTFPLPSDGTGNITNLPVFVSRADGDFHLHPTSPCIDAGTNLSAILTNDLDGNLRPLDGNGDGVAAFDMGAYEFDLRTVVPTNWFHRYGLDPADPHVVSGDPDLDALTTYQEWVADTDPTNSA